jgi:TatD DNase family protein
VEFDLPVILHVRRALDPILKQLRRYRPRGGIAHAFNGSRQQADEFIKLGFKLGFGGAMTFSGSTRIRELAATLPLEALVLETDAPDIPPAFLTAESPDRRNKPAYLPRFAALLAELRGMPTAALIAATGTNARAALPGLAALASAGSATPTTTPPTAST